MRVIFESFDGRQFETEEECRQYEKEYGLRVIDSIHTIQNYCKQFASCGECPFWQRSDDSIDCMFCKDTPETWNDDIIFNV